MNDSLSIVLFQRIAIIAVVAYVFSQTQAFRSLFKTETTLREKIVLIIIFTTVSICGTYFGIPIEGAFANVRDTGSIVAGLLGGPLVGAVTGVISGFHRISLGGFTALECGVATIIGGVLAGYINSRMKSKTPEVITGIVTGVGVVLFSMALILVSAKPFSLAHSLVYKIAIPMSLANAIGIAIFMVIIHNAREHQNKIGALQTNKALRIANAALPYFRTGLNSISAEKVAVTIKNMTSASAVAITDCETILTHIGNGADHHLKDQPLPVHTSHCLTTGQLSIIRTAQELECSPNCPLKSAIIVPLYCREDKVGTLIIYYSKEDVISGLDIEFAQGLGQIFSTQLELASLQKMTELATKAELKALRAQINPHFLFNSLNTIVSLCRTNSEEARHLIIELSDFFRRSLKSTREFITIHEELELVDSYLTLEKARFGQRLKVEKFLDVEALDVLIPMFTLQPLIENAVKHGLLAREQGGTVKIKIAKEEDQVCVEITDDGIGIPHDLLSKILSRGFGTSNGTGIGLSNVNERLKTIYGPQHSLLIDSSEGQGTCVKFDIPIRTSEGVVA